MSFEMDRFGKINCSHQFQKKLVPYCNSDFSFPYGTADADFPPDTPEHGFIGTQPSLVSDRRTNTVKGSRQTLTIESAGKFPSLNVIILCKEHAQDKNIEHEHHVTFSCDQWFRGKAPLAFGTRWRLPTHGQNFTVRPHMGTPVNWINLENRKSRPLFWNHTREVILETASGSTSICIKEEYTEFAILSDDVSQYVEIAVLMGREQSQRRYLENKGEQCTASCRVVHQPARL